MAIFFLLMSERVGDALLAISFSAIIHLVISLCKSLRGARLSKYGSSESEAASSLLLELYLRALSPHEI